MKERGLSFDADGVGFRHFKLGGGSICYFSIDYLLFFEIAASSAILLLPRRLRQRD